MRNTLALTLAIGAALPALAQTAPDAGQTLRDSQPPVLQAPRPSQGISVQPPAASATQPGGMAAPVTNLLFTGNTAFTQAQLQAVLADAIGKSYDLAGLRGLADLIGAHYRANGYPFARAFLPAQPMAQGLLRIELIEGRYGKISATGDATLAPQAQGFLAGLTPGAVIESAALERATLILDDQPGIKSTPIIRPGQELGTGDLIVDVAREPMVRGDVGFDNHGNRFTGEYRLRANVQLDSPFTLGDQITVRSLVSGEGLWLGSLGYSLPLGSSGLRANLGYAHTYYELAKDFASLQAYGTAKVTSAGFSYPLVRSQQSNLTLGAAWQYKQLRDQQDSTASHSDKSSNSLPISLQFDHRDGLGGGGISYGALAYTAGRLKLDSGLENLDTNSKADTRGSFQKLNLDVARLQATPVAGLTFFGRASVQWANKNLDSSEGFSLGGASGVRAYPNGEGDGDAGWLAQLEARYAMVPFSPYAFIDAGRVKVNADATSIIPAVTNNTRSLAGFGLGTRYSAGAWNLDAALAWRSRGGQPTSDTKDTNPRLWVTAGYQF